MGTSVNPGGGRQVAEHLDADAVCAQCGTVNVEETLMCKVCGNNLRDQKLMRLNAEAQLDGEAAGSSRRQWLARTLSVIGVLVCFLALYKIDAIQQWMISAQTEGGITADENWFGAQSVLFDRLSAELKANLPTPEEAEAAMQAVTPTTQYEGYYVLTVEGKQVGSALLRESAQAPPPPAGQEGEAVIRQTRYDFVATLGPAEVRGNASLRENSLSADWTSSAVRNNGEYIPASGVVIQQPNGTFEGYAKTEGGEQGYSFVAYRLSSP